MTKLDRARYLTGKHTAEDGTVVDFDGRYTLSYSPGVARYLLGWATEMTQEGYTLACAGEEYHHAAQQDPGEIEDQAGHFDACYLYDEPELVDRTDQVVAVMVGDDRQEVVDVADLVPLARADYCGECGQVGCQHDGYPRDDD